MVEVLCSVIRFPSLKRMEEYRKTIYRFGVDKQHSSYKWVTTITIPYCATARLCLAEQKIGRPNFRSAAPKIGTAALTGERAQATVCGSSRGRVGSSCSGKGCLRGRPRGRLGPAGRTWDLLPARVLRLGSAQGCGATW